MSVATSTRMEPSLKTGQGGLPGGLALVAVDGGGGDAGAGQILGHPVGPVLGAGKDQGGGIFFSSSSCTSSLDLLPLSTR